MGAKKNTAKKGNEGNLELIWTDFWRNQQAALTQQGMSGSENKSQIPSIDTKIRQAKDEASDINLQVGEEVLPDNYMRVLFETLVKSNFTNVKAIRFWNCTISDLAINKLSYYIREVKMNNIKTNELQELELLDCKLSVKGCEYIGNALEDRREHGEGPKNVRFLRLDSNNFGDEGFRRLNKGLRMNPNIDTISMNHCGLTENSSKSLLELLIFKESKIKELSLEGNNLKAQGAETIFKAMELNSSLQILNLADNKIEENEDFTKKFIKFIKVPELSIEVLQIQKNNIGMKTANELYRAISTMSEHQFNSIVLPDKVDKELAGRIGEFMSKKNKKGKKKKK